MATAAAVIGWSGAATDRGVLPSLKRSAMVSDVAIVVPSGVSAPAGDDPLIHTERLWSGTATAAALRWFDGTGAEFLVWGLSPLPELTAAGLNRLLACAVDTKAAMVYSDYFEHRSDGTVSCHPLLDYEPGSLRDDFDFGHVLLLSRAALTGMAAQVENALPPTLWGGWYDLRLRLAERQPVVHLPEPTYAAPAADADGPDQFWYVDPSRREYQREMERIATAHLKRIGALLEPPAAPLAAETGRFPVMASVIIPVRNRLRTVGDAVRSALSQQAPFAFNVIAVDNHSDDGTTEFLAAVAAGEPRLTHLIPARRDLGIGGCWNEAIHGAACGRYAVQLDSDDLYSGPDVLARVVGAFQDSHCAMVIGSYTLVDFDLQPIPPGLVDHREWTDENGHNNALRVAGFGAPRAFHVPTLRTIGFPNVSYGEDYAVALRLSRTYRLRRIYESLYWCRRWEDNSDHALPLATRNRYAAYKDRLRTVEIRARQSGR